MGRDKYVCNYKESLDHKQRKANLGIAVEGGEFVLLDIAVDVSDGRPGGGAKGSVDVADQTVDRLFQVLKDKKN